MQVDSECNVAAQCAAAATAIAERRWADVVRHANHTTRFAKATLCNEEDVASASAAVRAVTDAFEDAFSRGIVLGPRTVPLWEYDEGAERAALARDPDPIITAQDRGRRRPRRRVGCDHRTSQPPAATYQGNIPCAQRPRVFRSEV